MKLNYYFILVVFLLDQFTKSLARNISEPIVLINNFLSLTFITNTGAGFGIFKGFNTVFIFVSLIAVGLILTFIDKIKKKEIIYFALIIGGIFGNLIDRIFYGSVVDFIDFSFWPAFNIADAGLTIGVIGLIVLWWKK